MKKYLITDPKFYGNSEESFRNSIKKANKFDFILYRDKKSLNYRKFAKIFVDVLRGLGIDKIIIHQDPLLAKNLKAFGVHLTSQQFNEIKISKELNLFTIISTHSFKEIELANSLGADAVTFSPIFETPDKGMPKGVDTLQKAVQSFSNMKIFALGGVLSEVEINKLSKVEGLFGFSSIRFFIRKGIIEN